jgi:hypothetical protein
MLALWQQNDDIMPSWQPRLSRRNLVPSWQFGLIGQHCMPHRAAKYCRFGVNDPFGRHSRLRQARNSFHRIGDPCNIERSLFEPLSHHLCGIAWVSRAHRVPRHWAKCRVTQLPSSSYRAEGGAQTMQAHCTLSWGPIRGASRMQGPAGLPYGRTLTGGLPLPKVGCP